MIADGRNFIREAPWITLMPGIAVSMTVLGLNLLGDGLRDVLDPRMKVASS
jgi:peptide/nickel transport system permease protein